MMKTKKLLYLIGILILLGTICYDSNAQSAIAISVDQSDGSSIGIPCGGYYTSLLSHMDFNNGITVEEDTWIITNNSSESLTLQLPLTFSANSSPNLAITSQPQAVLGAGESTTFTTSYEYSFGSNDLGYIAINTGGQTSNECGFLLRGMIETVSLCQCYCADNNELSEICTFEIDGFLAGISIDEDICESDPEDLTCNSIQLVSTCDCNNILAAGSLNLYVDTMRILGLPGTDIVLSDNIESTEYSFLNRNGASIRKGTNLGRINSMGYVDIIVHRRPTTSINVKLNGVTFSSETACPLIVDCARSDDTGSTVIPEENMNNIETIPTLSEWSIFLLGLILMIISAAALRSPSIVEKSDKKLIL